MSNVYESGEYFRNTGKTWHSEDSPWKAKQIVQIIQDNQIQPRTIVEVGCGAGHILVELSKNDVLQNCEFKGFDISQQAIEICDVNAKNCEFYCQDYVAQDIVNLTVPDILLVVDVFEHVPDYLGFIEKCKDRAKFKIYHIPLDIHVSGVLRNSFINTRSNLGHLHYFTADSALATLRDTGHEILDCSYTDGSLGLFKQHPSIKRAIGNIPRYLLSKFSVPITARIFGGYSLLVLTK